MGDLNSMLRDMRQDGARSSAIISRDGLVIAADVEPDALVDTFAIMCATLMGAAVTANMELNRRPPELVTVESEDGKMLIMNAGRKAVVVSVLEKSGNEKAVQQRMLQIASEMKQS